MKIEQVNKTFELFENSFVKAALRAKLEKDECWILLCVVNNHSGYSLMNVVRTNTPKNVMADVAASYSADLRFYKVLAIADGGSALCITYTSSTSGTVTEVEKDVSLWVESGYRTPFGG
jgi:hypothetical protein